MGCQLVHVKAQPHFRICLEYADGISGEVGSDTIRWFACTQGWYPPPEPAGLSAARVAA